MRARAFLPLEIMKTEDKGGAPSAQPLLTLSGALLRTVNVLR